MNKRIKKLLIANITVAIGVIGFVIISNQLMGKDDYICSFYSLVHLYCPGCGGTRAFYSILQLDIVSAVRYNAAVPFGMAVYLYYNIRGFIEAIRENEEYFRKQKYYLCVAFVGVLILNFLVKNALILTLGIDIMPNP